MFNNKNTIPHKQLQKGYIATSQMLSLLLTHMTKRIDGVVQWWINIFKLASDLLFSWASFEKVQILYVKSVRGFGSELAVAELVS